MNVNGLGFKCGISNVVLGLFVSVDGQVDGHVDDGQILILRDLVGQPLDVSLDLVQVVNGDHLVI